MCEFRGLVEGLFRPLVSAPDSFEPSVRVGIPASPLNTAIYTRLDSYVKRVCIPIELIWNDLAVTVGRIR